MNATINKHQLGMVIGAIVGIGSFAVGIAPTLLAEPVFDRTTAAAWAWAVGGATYLWGPDAAGRVLRWYAGADDPQGEDPDSKEVTS